MVREMVKINEELCDGCGLCVPNCHEGALQVIDGKARLVSDLMCDGLGACLGHCPQGAISIEKREADPYNEAEVMKKMVEKGRNTVLAHLKHLQEHGETGFLNEAIEYMKQNRESLPFQPAEVIRALNADAAQIDPHQHAGHSHPSAHAVHGGNPGGCPGSRTMVLERKASQGATAAALVPEQSSELRQWPVQLHLVNPQAPYYRGADVLLAADCTAFALGNFHSHHLKGKALAIACPKLDSNIEEYVNKITSMIDYAQIDTLTVMIMQVPCCGGLLQIARSSVTAARRKVPVKLIVVSHEGEVIREEWQQ